MQSVPTVPSPVNPSPAALSSPRLAPILVVDDSAEVRAALAVILRSHGYGVRLASGGYEASRLIAAERPALILSDLHMPNGDGWELLVHCHMNAPDVPVILLSASDFGTHPEIEAGAVGRIAKPFSPRQLLSMVEQIFPRAPARLLIPTGRAA